MKMEIRSELQYTEDHEWLLIEGKTVTIGITDFAQDSLGDIVYVELPEVGTVVETGESLGNIESVKAVSEVFCPVDGEVVEINKLLEEEPEKVNSDPYDDGWMIKMTIDPASLREIKLLDEEEYSKLVETK